jgi:hypothetical protein
MQLRSRMPALPALALLGWILVLPAAAHAADDANEREAAMYCVTRWNADCDADRRDDWDNMVYAWYHEISNGEAPPDGHGFAAWTAAGEKVNGTINDSEFVDPDNRAWGDDVDHADVVDALMVGMHGGNNSDDHRWYGVVRTDEPGTGNCFTYQGHIELGDGDLEFLHLSSCFSMDREDWWNEWNSSFDGLHQVDGFHGIMWISLDYTRDYRRFADDSYWISIADSWLDHLYDTHWLLGNRDQCPVARVVGDDEVDAGDRLDTERYNNVFADPPGLGQARSHLARYIRGCNPRGMGALPQ